jgi:hypothetical protein
MKKYLTILFATAWVAMQAQQINVDRNFNQVLNNGFRGSTGINATVKSSGTQPKDSLGSNKAFPSYSQFSMNTGFGGLKRYLSGDETNWSTPVLLFLEKSGKLGNLDMVPNYVYYGGYFRWSKQEYTYRSIFTGEPIYTAESTILGFGVRGSISVLPALKDLAGKPMSGTGPIDLYAGFQAGYDIVMHENLGVYNYYYGSNYSSGLRVAPFIGGRFYPTKWFGVHAELGTTANRWLTVGIIFRKGK